MKTGSNMWGVFLNGSMTSPYIMVQIAIRVPRRNPHFGHSSLGQLSNKRTIGKNSYAARCSSPLASSPLILSLDQNVLGCCGVVGFLLPQRINFGHRGKPVLQLKHLASPGSSTQH